MASEIAYIPLAADANPRDPSSSAAQVWKATLEEISRQEGAQALYYGMCVETPSLLQLVVDWDSVDAHIKFTKSEGYRAFVKHVQTITDPDQPVKLFHVHFDSHPPKMPISAPVTELVVFHLTGVSTDAEKQNFEESANKLKKALEEHAKGFNGITGGFVVEELEHEDKKGLAFAALLGWDSVDAHMAFRETQPFKDAISLVRNAVRGAEMHHIKFDQFK